MKTIAILLMPALLSLTACAGGGGSGTHVATQEELKAQNDRQKVAKLNDILAIPERTFSVVVSDNRENIESAEFRILKESRYEFNLKIKDRDPGNWSGKYLRSDDSTKADLELQTVGTATFLISEPGNGLCIQLHMSQETTGKSYLVLCEKTASAK